MFAGDTDDFFAVLVAGGGEGESLGGEGKRGLAIDRKLGYYLINAQRH